MVVASACRPPCGDLPTFGEGWSSAEREHVGEAITEHLLELVPEARCVTHVEHVQTLPWRAEAWGSYNPLDGVVMIAAAVPFESLATVARHEACHGGIVALDLLGRGAGDLAEEDRLRDGGAEEALAVACHDGLTAVRWVRAAANLCETQAMVAKADLLLQGAIDASPVAEAPIRPGRRVVWEAPSGHLLEPGWAPTMRAPGVVELSELTFDEASRRLRYVDLAAGSEVAPPPEGADVSPEVPLHPVAPVLPPGWWLGRRLAVTAEAELTVVRRVATNEPGEPEGGLAGVVYTTSEGSRWVSAAGCLGGVDRVHHLVRDGGAVWEIGVSTRSVVAQELLGFSEGDGGP